MKRREFIALFGSAVVDWPLIAGAQQLPVVGFLRSSSPTDSTEVVAAFQEGLKETGFVGGQNVAIELTFRPAIFDH